MPWLDRDLADLLGGAAFERQRLDLGASSLITSYSPTRPR